MLFLACYTPAEGAISDKTSIYELKSRWDSLSEQYVQLAKQLVPLLDQFGKHREELQLLSVEIEKRGYEPDSPDKLIDDIEQKIIERAE